MTYSSIQKEILDTSCPNCGEDSKYIDSVNDINEILLNCTACGCMIDSDGGIIKN